MQLRFCIATKCNFNFGVIWVIDTTIVTDTLVQWLGKERAAHDFLKHCSFDVQQARSDWSVLVIATVCMISRQQQQDFSP